MKLLSRIFALCLGGALTLSALACSSGDPKESTPAGTSGTSGVTAPGTTGPTVPPSEPDPQPVSLTVAGVPLESYTIVFANYPYSKASVRKLFTDYDFYKLTAEHIAERIKASTGVTLTVARDTQTDESEYEILVGPTNRAQSDLFDSMDVYNYTCKVDGAKLVIGGGYNSTKRTGGLKTSYCFASTYHAWDYVEDYITKSAVDGKLDLAADFSLSGSRDLYTVACIGDSITEGYLSTDWNFNSYPAALQRILWQDYLILNYGNSGRTMRDDLVNPYKGTPQYNAAKRYAKSFDAALIMLGTNDSHFDRAWTDADDKLYNDSALSLAQMLTKSNENLKLVVMNCPVYYGTENSGSPRVRYLQAGLVGLYKDQGYDASFYNMHAYTETELGRSRFPDALHPDDRGYYLMADGLSKMLPALFDGTWNQEPEFNADGKPAEAPPDVAIPADSVNLLSDDLEVRYPADSNVYLSWKMQGAPYILRDMARLEGSVITNIEFPIAGCTKGSQFTVSVVKYSFPNLTETLSTHVLTADADYGVGWLKFGGLNIEIPEGYTLALGKPSDTIVPLYINGSVSGYGFYSVVDRTDNTTVSLAVGLYGKKSA